MKCVAYDVDCFGQQTKYCYWFLYPFYRTAVHIRNVKYRFYRYLNRKGIMKTPGGCVMCIELTYHLSKKLPRESRGDEYGD